MKMLISTECYIYNLGGITASVLALCHGLRQQGHEVKVLALSTSHHSFREGDDYFIRSFPAFYYPGMRTTLATDDPLLKELEDWHPDIIHVQTEGATYRQALRLVKRLHVPLVMTCHTDYAQFLFGNLRSWRPLRALTRAIGYRLYKPAVRVIAPSVKASKFIFLEKVSDRVTVVPNGLDLEKYRARFTDEQRLAFRKSLGIDESTVVFVAVTRLSKEKNLQELISFFPALLEKEHDVKFLIVGDGPYRKHLESMAETLHIQDRILFAGRIPGEDVWQYYSAGDIFVSASTFEVHSMSYLEALANGLPLLCRADDALEGVLEHGENGFVYRSREEFIDLACRLSDGKDLRDSMARRSLAKSDDFSISAFAASVSKVYEDALRASSKGGK